MSFIRNNVTIKNGRRICGTLMFSSAGAYGEKYFDNL